MPAYPVHLPDGGTGHLNGCRCCSARVAGFQIVRIAFLVMTMALAVALAGCSGAVGKPGPAGPQGPPSEPVTPTEPTQPTEPTGGQVPVQKIEGIDSIIFNDSKTGEMDTEPQTVMLANHFYPSGLTYELDGALPGKVSAEVIDGDVLTVGLKSGAPYDNFMLKVKASNEISSVPITFAVRRNRPPMVSMYITNGAAAAKGAITVWVGTQKPKEVEIVDLATVGAACGDDMDCVSVSTNGAPLPTALAVDNSFFYDDSGNMLKLVPEKLNTSKAAMLEVTGGSKVMLMGIKSTKPTGTDDDDSIQVDFIAEDDNGLTSQDIHVLDVNIDAAPTTVGAIGTRVIKASKPDAMRITMVTDFRNYFADDREWTAVATDPAHTLAYYAWSDNPEVALVNVNSGNVMKVDTASRIGDDDDVTGLTINAVNPGEAMITVRAVETLEDNGNTRMGTGGLKQMVDQTFKVVVQLD